MKGCSSATVTGASPTRPERVIGRGGQVRRRVDEVPSRSKTMVVSREVEGHGFAMLAGGRGKLFGFGAAERARPLLACRRPLAS